MQDSQNSDHPFNTTLTKLIEVDSELAVQEAGLLSQLESAQEKRRSLRTVISLFTEADTQSSVPTGKTAQESPAESAKELAVAEDLAAPALDISTDISTELATDELETDAALNTQSNEATNGARKKALPIKTNKGKSAKATQSNKTNKKISGWQDYVREEFSNESLSEAVSSVLHRQADAVWEIPAIINIIFMDELPQEVGNRARRRVTNILSEGVRKKEWYRGQLGYYSMSKAAVETSKSDRTA